MCLFALIPLKYADLRPINSFDNGQIDEATKNML